MEKVSMDNMGQLCNHTIIFFTTKVMQSILWTQKYNFCLLCKDYEINLDTLCFSYIYKRSINQRHIYNEIYLCSGCNHFRYLQIFYWTIINPLSPKYWRIYDQVKASFWILISIFNRILQKETKLDSFSVICNIITRKEEKLRKRMQNNKLNLTGL